MVSCSMRFRRRGSQLRAIVFYNFSNGQWSIVVGRRVDRRGYTGRIAGGQFEEPSMFKLHAVNPEQLRGHAVGSNVDNRPSMFGIGHMLQVARDAEARLDDRRDASGWKQGICGVEDELSGEAAISKFCNIL